MANVRTVRRSGLVLRGGRQRRETLWFGVFSTLTTLGVGSTAVLLTVLNAAALALRPFTIIRSRGELWIRSDQVGVAEDQSAAYAQAVVSEQASAIGVTAVPTPITDSSSDLFFVYQVMKSAQGIASGTSVGLRGTRYEVDSKAMRKVEEGEDVVQVIESDIAGVTAGVTIAQSVRQLIKLH